MSRTANQWPSSNLTVALRSSPAGMPRPRLKELRYLTQPSLGRKTLSWFRRTCCGNRIEGVASRAFWKRGGRVTAPDRKERWAWLKSISACWSTCLGTDLSQGSAEHQSSKSAAIGESENAQAGAQRAPALLAARLASSLQATHAFHTQRRASAKPNKSRLATTAHTPQVGKNLLPHVHRVAALLKRWLMGTHQGSVSRDDGRKDGRGSQHV